MALWLRGLNRQILLLTMSIVMGASVIIGLIALLVFYEYSKEQVLNRNQQIARDISIKVSGLVKYSMTVTESMAQDQELRSDDNNKSQVEMTCLYNLLHHFDGMALIDKNGRIVAFAPYKSSTIGIDLSARHYFRQVMQNGKAAVSEPFLAATGNCVVVTASPVLDGSGKVSKILATSLNLKKSDQIPNIINAEVSDPSMVIQLISKDGKIVYHPDRNMIMKDVEYNPAIAELLKGKSGARTINVNNETYLTGYAYIPDLNWGVLVEYPKDQALLSAVYLRDLMILVTIFICFLVLFVTYLEAKAIIKPLEILAEGVKRVGDGDYHFNVNVKANNEIGILASSFNSMVERIKQMREDILQKKAELEKANSELQVMAITDGLTKLYNHRYFQDCLEKAVVFAREEKQTITLMILDIDHFKYYNDLFGHQAGDRLLEELAQLLIRELGPNDMVARYGGEEFTIILYGSDNQHGMDVAERLRRAVEFFPFPGREQQPEGKITVSIGVASYPENAKTKEELVRLADEALYKAKCCSRNKVELYFSVLDELKQDLDQSEVELVNSIKMLIRIINAKDKYTYGHSERVGRYAVWIAEKMDLPEDEIQTIKMGAFLHDIGKIEISRGVLMKRGPLNEEEFELIKKHPLWGAGIIKAVESLNQTLPLIKFHHERFDGNGYPKGLKGTQIPLHARILAVADSYDAMTSNRPYRKRKTVGEAVEELKKCAGTQFDPEVVEAFLCVLQEHEEKVG